MSKARVHGRSSTGSFGIPLVAGALVVVAGVGTAGFLVATHRSGARTRATLISTRARSAHSHHHHAAPPPKGPLGVAAISPSSSSASVPWQSDVTVRYTEPLAPSSPLPTLSPSPAGSWYRVGPETVQFRPVSQFTPYQHEIVTVPAASVSTGGMTLGHDVRSAFKVKGASVLRLQELLAELGYLPVAFTPAGGSQPAPASGVPTSATPGFKTPPSPPSMTGTTVATAPSAAAPKDFEPSSPGDVPREALAGSFSWRFPNIPPMLAGLWTPGQANVITTGAVMEFEAAHGLSTDGVAGPLVWKTLLKAAAEQQVTTAPYDYVYVSQASPEFVTVWRDGVNVFTTLANTGIPQSPTAVGTWPVYLRYRVTTMSGTNPNGTPYNDPGIPWVSYFNGGDALHGFIRAAYGFPQSLGCVEMPFSSAAVVWPYTPIGTLVTIE